jgi:hypothetical protein
VEAWDVRPVHVVAANAGAIVLLTGGWGISGRSHLCELPGTQGGRAIVRRAGPEGIAEWEGHLAAPNAPNAAGALAVAGPTAAAVLQGAQEMVVEVRLTPAAAKGRFYQRRRSPRLAVRLSPVRLTPLQTPNAAGPSDGADYLPPVARLADVSAHGASVVVDCPLAGGTPVALEFELPGEPALFSLRGRVVEPAVPLHGQVQPQPDGLPGFRRGIEFLSGTASREGRRLAAALAHLLGASG